MRGLAIHSLTGRPVKHVTFTKYGTALDFGEQGAIIVAAYVTPAQMRLLKEGKTLPHLERRDRGEENPVPMRLRHMTKAYADSKAEQDMKKVKEDAGIPEHTPSMDVPDMPSFLAGDLMADSATEEELRETRHKAEQRKFEAGRRTVEIG